MKIPGPGPIQFIRGVGTLGFLGFVASQFREHGDLFQVRLGLRPMVFAKHPDIVKHVVATNRQNYDKRETYDPLRKYLLGAGLVTSTGELWRRQRRLMAPFYTTQGIQAYAQMMIDEGERTAARWQAFASTGADVEMSEEMTEVTASIILKAMFSAEKMESMHDMKEAVETMVSFAEVRMRGIAPPAWLPTATNRRYAAARELVHRSIEGLIAQRRATDEAQWPDDLLARLMKARDEETGEPMSETLLRDESITTFVGGHDTTARTMTALWYALAANPSVMERLQEELDRVLGGRTPTVDQLRQLPYTLRVIKEVLRLYPAFPLWARDALAADQVLGFDVPAGASMMVSPYFTHRHPQFWEDPEMFDPERFTREREAARHSHAYHPFAAGQRVCIGSNLALLESQILVAILAQRFTPRLPPDYAPRWEMQGTLGLTNGLPMVIAPR